MLILYILQYIGIQFQNTLQVHFELLDINDERSGYGLNL